MPSLLECQTFATELVSCMQVHHIVILVLAIHLLGLDHTIIMTKMTPGAVAVQVVLVVAQDLHMSPGKLAAQCAHAAVGIYKLMVRQGVPWLAAWEVRTPSSSDCGVASPRLPAIP